VASLLLALDQIDGQTSSATIAGADRNEFGQACRDADQRLDLIFPSVAWATDRPRIAVP
jgi:hypothetical protein